jgi:hypothetical protein
MTSKWLRDPTSETSAIMRARRAPPASLAGKTIALFDIGKARSDEFLDRLGERLKERGLTAKRYGKPTNAKVAPVEIIQKVATEADVVVIGLSD